MAPQGKGWLPAGGKDHRLDLKCVDSRASYLSRPDRGSAKQICGLCIHDVRCSPLTLSSNYSAYCQPLTISGMYPMSLQCTESLGEM